MTFSTCRNKSVRIAATLMVGLAATSFAPGCDSAPGQGSLDMGGKEGRDKITPGSTPAPPAEGEKPKNPGATPTRSIKERPAG